MEQLNTVVDNILTAAKGKSIWLAFSGGVDSHVLLHLLATHSSVDITNLHAIHINHGLQSQSQAWAEQCADVARQLNVDFRCIEVDVKNIDKLGMEAAARDARYAAIASQVSENDVVLTAQHQEDQAETLLLQLLRGAGPKGLSAMAGISTIGDAELIRPLLGISKQMILDYADLHQLQWIEDPSNADTRWARNFVRHSLWPIIEKRWPAAASTLSRSAGHCAEAAELMSDLAFIDLRAIGYESGFGSVSVSKLMSLSPARYKNVLRTIFEVKKLAMPSASVLQKVIDEVCLAKQDATPVVTWNNVLVRRYRDHLFIDTSDTEVIEYKSIIFTGLDKIDLAQHQLEWFETKGEGLRADLFNGDLSIKYRQGGERIRLNGHEHHKSVKHLFQQWAVPPWLRDTIPFIYYGDELIAIVGYGFADGYCVTRDEQGYLPVFKRTDTIDFN